MRILCLTSRLPYPPNRGDRLRAFHIIEHLAAHHELTLASFIAHEREREHTPALAPYCRVHTVTQSPRRSVATAAGNIWRRAPLQTLYYRSRAMQRLVDELIASTRFDAAYVHLFRMAPYLVGHSQLFRVVDLTDVISREISRSLPYRDLASRLLYWLEGRRISRYECDLAQRFEEAWLISEADRGHLAASCPRSNLHVVPNGVDTEQFHAIRQPPERHSMVFVGHLGVLHNIDAARFLVDEILPLVRQQIPDCKLYVVGAHPAPEVQRLGQVPGVRVTGFVPDLNQALNRAEVFVAPLRFAAGVQNKVLEAMAAARPVVTTSMINDGLGAAPGRELLVADDPGTISGAVVQLLRDAHLRDQVGRAGQSFVRSRFSWQHAVRRMAAIEQTLLGAADG